MSITKKEIDHVIKLSHVTVSQEERDLYMDQLNKVFDHMDVLNQLDLKNVEPSSYAFDSPTLLREDKVVVQKDLLLEKNAPDWENGCFSVPKIQDHESA